MKKTALLSVLIVSVIISALNLSYAQTTSDTLVGPGWVHQIGAGWMIVILIGGALIFIGILLKGYPSAQKYLAIGGLVIVFIGTFGVEIIYLLPYVGQPAIGYQECKNLQGSFVNLAACIFTGYAPAGLDAYNIAVFFIFGFISPIVILFILFNEFTEGLVTNPNAKRVLAVVITLVAYRGLLASLFIDLLMYGFAGVGVLAMNYLIFGIIYNMIKKMWMWGEAVESLQRGTDLMELLRLRREYDIVTEEYHKALREGKMDVAKELEERRKRIGEMINKLKGKV